MKIAFKDRQPDEKMRQVGETMRQVGETPRQVGETMRQVGETMRQVGETMRQVGETMRQVGETMRQVGETMRQVGEKMRQVGRKGVEMIQNRVDLAKNSQKTSFRGRRDDETQTFLGQKLLASSPAVRKVAAFTMIEIAISLAVIAFALVAIIGVLPTGMNVQKDNREDTIINQDGPFFLEAIRNGNRGLDYLTNYVDSITVTTNLGDIVIYTNAPGFNTFPYNGSMTNGEKIVGLLSKQKYEGTEPNRITNSIVAKVRALTGSATEQGKANPDFAFAYSLTSEVTAFQGSQISINSTNYNDTTIGGTADEVAAEKARRRAEWVRVMSRQNNSSEIKLTFRWPLFQGNQTGPSHQSFRAIVSGMRSPPINDFQFFQPQTFTVTPAP